MSDAKWKKEMLKAKKQEAKDIFKDGKFEHGEYLIIERDIEEKIKELEKAGPKR